MSVMLTKEASPSYRQVIHSFQHFRGVGEWCCKFDGRVKGNELDFEVL